MDGFTGNITLKAVEGTVRLYTEYLRQTYRSSLLSKLSYFLAKGAFKKMRARIDPRIYNGATFLGLNGIVIKSHGNATPRAFAYALKNCSEFIFPWDSSNTDSIDAVIVIS